MMALPTVLAREGGQFTLFVPADLEAFTGHFPGDPILPGVVQVDWAIRLGAEVFGPLGPFSGLDQVKFLEPIRPGATLTLDLALDRGSLKFQYSGAQGRITSGIARFGGAP